MSEINYLRKKFDYVDLARCVSCNRLSDKENMNYVCTDLSLNKKSDTWFLNSELFTNTAEKKRAKSKNKLNKKSKKQKDKEEKDKEEIYKNQYFQFNVVYLCDDCYQLI